MFSRIPEEVKVHIVKDLDVKTKVNLALTSKRWHQFINKDKQYSAAKITFALMSKKINIKDSLITNLRNEFVVINMKTTADALSVMESGSFSGNNVQNKIRHCIQGDIDAIITLLKQPESTFTHEQLMAYALLDIKVAEAILSNSKLSNQLKEADLISIAKMDASLAVKIFNSPALYTKFSAISLCTKSKLDPEFAKIILKHENLLTILSNQPAFFGTFMKQHAELADQLPAKFAKFATKSRRSVRP